MSHEHPRGADHEWYLEHLAQDHLKLVDPQYSRSTVMALHREAHLAEEEAVARHYVAPFHDRRPRQVEVIERKRPVRAGDEGSDDQKLEDAFNDKF